VIPVHNAAGRVSSLVDQWNEALRDFGRDYAILVVNDGSTDGTGTAAAELAASNPRLRILAHEKRQGFGACLRTALADTADPFVAYALTDYPYTPADLRKLLERFDQPCDVYGADKTPDAVSGCRTGRPVPGFWRAVGWGYRSFCRIALGATIEPAAGWLGLREHARSWVTWLAMGIPLSDVNCGLKLFRRSVFDRFPIQSDGDFAHAEIFAKLTFLTCLVAEEPLTPAADPIPPARWSEFWKVFRGPKFHHQLPDHFAPPPAPPPDTPAALP
jgi:glycosyltransferase involved in cell wall biosynthesis